MKCPKCGYLGFETVDRCRNCGYDFSLTVDVQTPSELPLRGDEATDGPLADFDISRPPSSTPPSLDLNRVIGEPEPQPEPEPERESPPSAVAPLEQEHAVTREEHARGDETDDAPLLTAPRPARPPLAVRRSTPDMTRGRNRSARPVRREEPALALELDSATDAAAPPGSKPEAIQHAVPVVAGVISRGFAGLIDGLLLLGINAAVIYFTLAITGLTLLDLGIIPPIPMGAFLILLNGGYLVGFTAASGQTIGKMITGIRVEGDDGQRVDMAGAVLRAAGFAVSVMTLGLGFLPALFGRRRALHDRLAGTQVVAVR